MDPVTELGVVSMMAVLGGLLALTFVLGAAVALKPQLLDWLRAKSDLRVSMRRATRVFDKPRNVDHIFYRYHRAYGGAVVSLSILLLYFLVFGELRPGWSEAMGIDNDVVTEILVTSARGVLWVFAVFALIIGTIVLVRPSALKGMEQWANRWLTPRRLTRGAEREYYPLERGVYKYPRAWGIVVAVASFLCLLALYIQWRASGLAG